MLQAEQCWHQQMRAERAETGVSLFDIDSRQQHGPRALCVPGPVPMAKIAPRWPRLLRFPVLRLGPCTCVIVRSSPISTTEPLRLLTTRIRPHSPLGPSRWHGAAYRHGHPVTPVRVVLLQVSLPHAWLYSSYWYETGAVSSRTVIELLLKVP